MASAPTRCPSRSWASAPSRSCRRWPASLGHRTESVAGRSPGGPYRQRYVRCLHASPEPLERDVIWPWGAPRQRAIARSRREGLHKVHRHDLRLRRCLLDLLHEDVNVAGISQLGANVLRRVRERPLPVVPVRGKDHFRLIDRLQQACGEVGDLAPTLSFAKTSAGSQVVDLSGMTRALSELGPGLRSRR